MAEYRGLDSSQHEIRLIELHPATEWSTIVRVTLSHAFLHEAPAPAFETISYVWGDPKVQELMVVDGNSASVPASAVAALRRMRFSTTHRTLWIDALCINQSDVRERSEQVKIMGEIYKASQGNLIFLGEVSDDQKTKLAFSNIRAIIDEMNEETKSLSLISDTVFDREREGRRPKLATSGMGFKVEEEALESQIFSLPWFRLWVFQEAALAPSNTCVLGDYIMDFLDIARASHWIAHKQKFVSRALMVSSGRGTASALFDYVDREHGSHGSRATAGREHVPLEQLMSDTFELLASDPRDKIYAILGLRDWPNGVPKLLVPDYSKSEAELFRDASRFALETPGEYGLSGLESLNTLEEDLRIADFVSWAIFPSRAYDSSREPEVLNGGLFRCSGGGEQLWSADHGTPSTIAPDVLVVAGTALGEIEAVSPSLTQDNIGDVIALEHWLEVAITLFRAAKYHEIGTIASVLIAGTNFEEQLATDDDLASLDDLRWTLKHLKRVPHALDRDTSSSDSHSSSTTRDAKARRYFFAFKRASLHRKAFRTDQGYIGLGSRLSEHGDEVVIIYGADLPFVLRPKEHGRHQLLATCYVHDAMFGEAVNQHKQRGNQSQLFHLQ